MKWLKQLFCNHHWKCIQGWQPGAEARFQCTKCGKVEGL